MTDKQRQVQAARDALTAEGDDGGSGTYTVTTTRQGLSGGAGGPILWGPPLIEPVAAIPQLPHIITTEDALIREAIEALIAWHMQSGIDRGDRLRTAAKKLWEMRETRT